MLFARLTQSNFNEFYMDASSPHLSKSLFLSGLQCKKRLWNQYHQPDTLAELSGSDERMMEQGAEVGRYARLCFPHGVLIDSHGASAIVDTRRAIKENKPVIFEASFQAQDVTIRCDILEQADSSESWQLIEVKSTTSFDPELHIPDLAIQWAVADLCGVAIESAHLMYINSKDCRYPDLSNLFNIDDVTAEVQTYKSGVLDRLNEFKSLLIQPEPHLPIGKHCHKPHLCPLKDQCWSHVPEKSIFTIPRLNQAKTDTLIASNCLAIEDLPDDFPLSQIQKNYVQSVKTRQVFIDKDAIRAELDQLDYPLYFFDFETLNPALPRFDGMRPYEQFPFQYSCHIMQEDGSVTHHDYLHEDETDPRIPLINSLIAHFGSVGHIVAYNAAFEKRILKQLSEYFPDHTDFLNQMISRLWDQMLIFKGHYRHPEFLGSFSIKNVLPVLVPGLSYSDLDVQKGDQAQAEWELMIREPVTEIKQKKIKALKAYCKLDTLAMVELHRVLRSV